MDTTTVLGTIAGGGFGYLIGVDQGKKLAPDNSNADVNVLSQQVLLLKTQIEAQRALITALSSQSGLNEAVREQLQVTIDGLEDKLAGAQVSLGGKFPAIFGSGDPAQAGWIKGRDGLLINRVLPNFISTDCLIAVSSGWDSTRPTVGMSIADITSSLPARSITIGQAMNTALNIVLNKGVYPSMCVVLNFAEDVADDTDFVSAGYLYDGNIMHTMCVPIGRNSLMLMPLAMATVPGYYSTQSWGQGMTRDIVAGDDGAVVTTPIAAQRVSFSKNGALLLLGHRTARNLTLRSWNIVAHPLGLWQESMNERIDAKRLSMTRRQGAVTVVERHNTSVTPKFYRPNETGEYDLVELSSSVYL